MLRHSSSTFKTLKITGLSRLRMKAIILLTLLKWCGLSGSSECRSAKPPQDSDHSETNPPSNQKANPTYTLAPKSAIDYSWDYPAAREKKILLTINGWRRPVDILEIGNLMPFKFGVRSRKVFIDSSDRLFCRVVQRQRQFLWMFGPMVKPRFCRSRTIIQHQVYIVLVIGPPFLSHVRTHPLVAKMHSKPSQKMSFQHSCSLLTWRESDCLS